MATELTKSNRIEEIDVIKALAIICMVWGHIGLPGTNFVYRFHMAVFFICSGIVYKEKYSDSISAVWRFTKNKILSLYVPYAMCAVLFTLFNNFFLWIGFYNPEDCPYLSISQIVIDCIRALLFVRGTQLGGATWFLRTLFFVSELFVFLDFLFRKWCVKFRYLIQFGLSLVFLILFYFLRQLLTIKFLYTFIGSFVLGYSAFCMGKLIASFDVVKKLKSLKPLPHIFILSLTVLILFFFNASGRVDIDRGNFKDPLFFISMSVSGFLFLFYIAYCICLVRSLKNGMLIIGQNTLSIVLLHLLIFKCMNVFFVNLLGLDRNLTSAFPTLYAECGEPKFFVGGGYLCIGIFIPIALNLCKKKLIALWKGRHK